ncbi:carbohydrate esterase family 1 protein [Pisolithus tinctorius]|nr:carbohydrate esterase family 1 protein [Pisolithus tinctorius]
MAKLEQLSCSKHFGGKLTKYKFRSTALGDLDARLNIFLPGNSIHGKVPVLMYLGGLTCTEDNAAQKGGFMRDAAAEGIAIIFPDTSPRGAGIQGEDDHWDFGTGAGWYVDATHPQWAKHYRMFTHVTQELPQIIEASGLPVDFSRQSILGHSMGGHGALVLYLTSILSGRNTYRSCSAFSPVCAPSVVPWGIKGFNGYLAGGVEEGRDKYDATTLIGKVKGPVNILIDYGTADEFKHQLKPDLFADAARKAGFDESQVRVRGQDDYDHSYYFVSTFASEHVKFHAGFLKA